MIINHIRRINTMARIKEKPLYNIISMRISEGERRQLLALVNTTHQSVSDLMREAIKYFAASQEHAKLNSSAT